MGLRRVVGAVALLLGLPPALAAQQGVPPAGAQDSVRADSARADSTLLPGLRWRSEADSIGLGRPSLLTGAPAATGAVLLGPVRRAVWDSALAQTLDSAETARASARRNLLLHGISDLPRTQREDSLAAAELRRGAFGLDRKYADLTIDGQARLEIRTDRMRNLRCTAADLANPGSGCRGGFRAPRLDNQLSVRAGGLIGRRVHVGVDYDQQREFSGSQDVRVFYEGLEDEIVRRIEVGTVTFQTPPSRFLTSAIPRNNFGLNALFELGPFQFQTLAATQKGSQVAERRYDVGTTTSQPQERQVREVDFESGRFFWVPDPRALAGWPRVDILNVSGASAPPGVLPADVRVYRQRAPSGRSNVDPNLGGIRAVAVDTSGALDKTQTGRWELLAPDRDYYVDPSGLWIALATKLGANDFLAVSYTTQTGTVVGTFPESVRPGDEGTAAPLDTLVLVADGRSTPEYGSFHHEMRQIYRLGGGEVDLASLGVSLSLNRSQRPASGAATYLALFGLSVPTDPNLIDRENRVFPRVGRDPEGAREVLKEVYLVFPELRPFENEQLLQPAERNTALYQTRLLDVQTSQGPASQYSFRLSYNATGAGDRNTLSLNALQIREGSEVLTLGGRNLEKGVDYTIDYELGVVTFLRPEVLFGTGGGQVLARFEERETFAVAPTTLLGFTTRYSLGETGAINFVALSQREQTSENRPRLGFEAKANTVLGLTTQLRFQPRLLDRLLNGLVTTPASAPSRLDVNAEVAVTRPDPNRANAAYLEDFEGEAGLVVPLGERAWEFGSAPQRADGAEDLGFSGSFDPEDAVQLTWQNLVAGRGNQVFEFRTQDIDTLVTFSGRGETFETVMFLTLHADTAGGVVQRNRSSRWSLEPRPGRPRWRSMVTALSPSGIDLSRTEYLEFWAYQPTERTADAAGLRVIVDLGRVNEDALALAPDTMLVAGSDTTFRGRQFVGRGVLDTERHGTGVFNAVTDDIGILGDRPEVLVAPDGGRTEVELCRQDLSATVLVYPWGDLSSRCTVGNGQLDTEDLNGDNQLNESGANEDVSRYVVDLTDPKYFVRTGVVDERGGGWSLYRIPLRSEDAITLGTPNLRQVQHLRLTLAAPASAGDDRAAQFAVARMRLVGSPWTRRAESPIRGLAGRTGQAYGEVVATVISTEAQELGYTSPPGVVESTRRRNEGLGEAPTQINEKSLRLIGRGLEVGDRVEAYLRFASGPQNLLKYRELRVWAHGDAAAVNPQASAAWESGELQAFVKLGSDPENFYLYRTRARSTTWEPEMVIDLEAFRVLRGQLEAQWLAGQGPSGGAACGLPEAVDAYVACRDEYLVYLGSPGVNPPNLAAVQEVSAGFYRAGGQGVLPQAEVWIDDLRLAAPVSDAGTAMAVDARLAASDVGDLTLSLVRQDGDYYQIGQAPTYRTTSTMQLGSTWRLERFLPPSLGYAIQAGLAHARTGVDPQLLNGTDLRGADLAGLRRPESWSTNYSLVIRRNKQGRSWIAKGLLDPLAFSARLSQGRSTTELSNAESDARAVDAQYNLTLRRSGFRLGLGGLVDRLPGFLRRSELANGLRAPLISLVPTRVRFESGVVREQSLYNAFPVAVVRPDDALIPTTLGLNYLWRSGGGVTWQPLGMLSLSTDLSSRRDLRHYPDSTPIGRLAGQERRSFLGIDAGVERDRTLGTNVAVTPRVSTWLRPRFVTTSQFTLSRSLTSRPLVRSDGDTLGPFILPQTLNNTRSREYGVAVDLARALRQLASDSSGVGKLLERVRPVDVARRVQRGSTFDLAAFQPTLSYQLGLGGLEHFLDQFGSAAIGASEARSTTVSGGADLPFGLSVSLSYTDRVTDRYQRSGEGMAMSVTDQTEWPVANARFLRTFRGGPLSLLSLGTTLRQRKALQTQPGVGERTVQSDLMSSAVSPELQVGLRNGFVVQVSFNSLRQRTVSNGSLTHVGQGDWLGSANYTFRLPPIFTRLPQQVRSSVFARSSDAETCLVRFAGAPCEAISSTGQRELRGTLDTNLSRSLSGGLSFGYLLNDARHVARRNSQVSLSVNFQLSLFAGDYR